MLTEDYLADNEFSHVGCLLLEKDGNGEPLVDNPQESLARSELHAKLEPPFCRLRLPKLPKAAGVYVIVIAEQAVYVGRTDKSLAARFGGYKKIGSSACKARGGQITNCRINHRILEEHKKGHTAHLWFRKYIDLEKAMMEHFRPSWNQQLK